MNDETQALIAAIAPEMGDIAKLFGLSDTLWGADGAPLFSWRAKAENGQYRCTVTCAGIAKERTEPIPQGADERLLLLEKKRVLKRLCKQALYDYCREKTGRQPPWGSLTGIRPTRLIYAALDKGASLDGACAQVGERYDVSAEKLALLREVVETQRRLVPPDDAAANVYVGIPFCTTRCAYCTFSSGEIGRGTLVEPYLTALFREMEACADILAQSGKHLRAVYVGGGTPTALNEKQFARLLERLVTLYPHAAETPVEAGRPDTITMAKLQAIKAAGIGRISINHQTMNNKTLTAIGRRHTVQQVLDAYDLARRAGIGHINMDVIAGLPGEDIEDFRRTMDGALALHPESLTVHTLAIKRSSLLHLEQYPLPTDDAAAQMVRMGRETAAQLGLRPYYLYRQKNMADNQENVGYALPKHACQYNVDIMEETTHILAMGAGGISKRILPEEGHIRREPNVSNIGVYIDRVEDMIDRKRSLFLD